MLIETIRVTDGRYCNAPLHLQRMERSVRELFGCSSPLTELPPVPARYYSAGEVKCRILYGKEIERLEFDIYRPRNVKTLRLVEGGDIDYHLKYANRSRLDALRALRGDCDDIVILRDGIVTDTSYSNLLFLSDKGIFTPSLPLLCGTMRQSLIESGAVKTLTITGEELLSGAYDIHSVLMINAMLPPGAVPAIPVEAIYF